METWKYLVMTTVLVILSTCCSKPVSSGRKRGKRGMCHPKMLAEYNLTFYADWSSSLFPKNYPRVRPPAQWSKLVGRSHDNTYKLWVPGKNCSDAVKAFAEDADSSMLDQDAQAYRGIFDSFTAAPIKSGMGRSAVRFLADGKHPKMSFIVKIIPSPDWFVGVNSLNLCHKGRWRRKIEVDLAPMDAGTDQGLTFTSPSWPEVPHVPIRRITNVYPRHPAGGFYYPELDKLPRIGHIVLTKVAEYKRRGRKLPASPTDPNVIIFDSESTASNVNVKLGQLTTSTTNRNSLQEMPKDCLVSDWSEWSFCSRTCGFGHRRRQRRVLQQPVNGGLGCPKLSDQSTCGSMRRCDWKHFNFFTRKN